MVSMRRLKTWCLGVITCFAVYTVKRSVMWQGLGLGWLPDKPGEVEDHQDEDSSCKEQEDSFHGPLSQIREWTSVECIGLFQANLRSCVGVSMGSDTAETLTEMPLWLQESLKVESRVGHCFTGVSIKHLDKCSSKISKMPI